MKQSLFDVGIMSKSGFLYRVVGISAVTEGEARQIALAQFALECPNEQAKGKPKVAKHVGPLPLAA